MKSAHEVMIFLKSYRGKEIDELAIIQYCVQYSIRVKFTASPETSKIITFEYFKEWFTKDIPSRGEIIYLEDSKLIVLVLENEKENHIKTCLSLDSNNDLRTNEHQVQLSSYRKVTDKELQALQLKLSEQNISWNRKFYRFTPRITPTDNQQIRLSLVTKKLGFGAFKEINSKGELIMYCVKLDNKPLRYSLEENMGKVDNYQIDICNLAERECLKKELENIGYLWNGYSKRIEPLNYRTGKGGNYYYINSYLEICITRDYRKPKDNKRYSSGNYFLKEGDAETLLDDMKKLRKKMFLS